MSREFFADEQDVVERMIERFEAWPNRTIQRIALCRVLSLPDRAIDAEICVRILELWATNRKVVCLTDHRRFELRTLDPLL